MSHDGKKDEEMQKNVRDTVAEAEETKEDVRDTVAEAEETKEDVRDTVAEAEETKEDVRDTVREDLGEDKYFTERAKKLRERAAEIVEDYKSTEPKSARIEQEPDTFKQHNINRTSTELGKVVINKMARKPIITVLVIGAVILVGVLLYTSIQYGSNQSERIENSKALWNQSLIGLSSGNLSVTEYCNQNPHDQKLCDLFWNLKYM